MKIHKDSVSFRIYIKWLAALSDKTEKNPQRSKTGKDHKREPVFTVDMYLPQWSTESKAKKP